MQTARRGVPVDHRVEPKALQQRQQIIRERPRALRRDRRVFEQRHGRRAAGLQAGERFPAHRPCGLAVSGRQRGEAVRQP
jgi:hypothetical protein